MNPLSEKDYLALERCYITRDLADRACLRRVDSEEGGRLVGRNGHGDYSGIVFSYHLPGETHPREHRLRRDHPDIEQSNGTLKERAKYLSPPGGGNRFYFPPGVKPEWLKDTSIPIGTFEGEKKCLAMSRVGLVGDIPKFIPIGLAGVWGWRGRVGKGPDAKGRRTDYKGAIPDFNLIEWRNRTVYLIFDTNVHTNEKVRGARSALRNELEKREAKVLVVELPEIEGVNGPDDLLALKGPDFLLDLIRGAKIEEPGIILSVVRMADVVREEVEWFWHPYIPYRRITIVEGEEGIGKSFLTLALITANSLGRGLPGRGPFEPGTSLLLSAEDGLGDTVRPRLEDMGADLSRVFAVDQPLTLDEKGVLLFKTAIDEYRPSVVVIDPLFAYVGGKMDINSANQSRAISTWLGDIAEARQLTIIEVRHLGKSKGMGDARAAGLGSIDWRAAARSVLLAGWDRESDERGIVQTKNNLAEHGDAVGYSLAGGRFAWKASCSLTKEKILQQARSDEERHVQSEAETILRDLLADGPQPSKEVVKEMRAAGFNDYQIRAARERMGVKSGKEGFGRDGTWNWSLPKDADKGAEPPKMRYEKDFSHLKASGENKASYGNDLAKDAKNNISTHLSDDFASSDAPSEPGVYTYEI